MSLIISQLSLADLVVLYEWTVCGANEGAAAALHTQIDLILVKARHSVLLGLDVESASELDGIETKRAGSDASAAMDTSGRLI